MKKTSVLIFILLILSCNHKNKTEKKQDIKNEETNIIKEKAEPLFLNLSPKLPHSEFNERLKNNSDLDDEKFILNLNNSNSKFRIDQKSDRITLSFNNIEKVSVDRFSRSNSEYYLKNNEEIVSSFLKIFKEKYSQSEIELPFSVNEFGEYYNDFYNRTIIGGIEKKN